MTGELLDRDSQFLDAVVRGLADRVKALLMALDRRDRLETAGVFVGWLEAERANNALAEINEEILLRAMRVAADPQSFRLLAALDPLRGVQLDRLMDVTGLKRVAVSERVNDLVQVGLASRELIGDEVRGTPLASGLVAFVEKMAEQAARRLEEELPPRADLGDDGGDQ